MTDNRAMQSVARETMDVARQNIRAGQTLASVRQLCEDTLRALGADSFWYWGIGALVLCGDDTISSVSGREYTTADRIIRAEELITIDLSPQRDDYWGDFARTIIVENGVAIEDARLAKRDDWRAGVLAEAQLHHDLIEVARPSMTFEKLHEEMNSRIHDLGFENLDFLGNVGHSIERRIADRIYIEKGNSARIGDTSLFTFEPHIRRPGKTHGFKHENIYFFEHDRLMAL
ncbi:M24 family metallopeptidase [Rhodoglobus sp. NPDC076762]